jgi:hypothetical protein
MPLPQPDKQGTPIPDRSSTQALWPIPVAAPRAMPGTSVNVSSQPKHPAQICVSASH